MKNFKYVIRDKIGMHARPANKLVQFLSSYKSSVMVKLGDKEGNAKSLVNVMSLGIENGSEVEFIVNGEDEDKVVEDLPAFLSKEGI